MVASQVTGEFNYPSGSVDQPGLLLTRLAPPPQQARLLRRQRIDRTLAAIAEHPLSIVVAPAGSGKTTALALFGTSGGWPMAWCRVADEAPTMLLRHLAAAFRTVAPIDEQRIAATLLSNNSDNPLMAGLELLVNELAAALNDDTLLVLDDYHIADHDQSLRVLVERLYAIQPLRLHIALATRSEPTLSSVATAQVRGEVHRVEQHDLAFTPAETAELFRLHAQPLPDDASELTALCRGWPLALQIILGSTDWRSALGVDHQHHESVAIDSATLPLDEYFEQEVLAKQPDVLRSVLLRTAVLRWLSEDACREVVQIDDVAAVLSKLQHHQLFLEQRSDGHYQYQPLFHAFLERCAARELTDWHAIHQRAATYYRDQDDRNSTIYHLLAAGNYVAAADAVEDFAPEQLAAGESEVVLAWIKRLPLSASDRPRLLEFRATAYRHQGQFEAALHDYQAAEAAFAQHADLDGQVRTLRGQAEVYLDTVQPTPAVALLKRALKLLPPDRSSERAELLRLQAENWANRGRADIALLLEQTAQRMEDGERGRSPSQHQRSAERSVIPARLLLRSGRLHEARQQIEAALHLDAPTNEDVVAATAGGHREPPLLLAFIYALLGSGTRALAMARRGLLEAQQNDSQLTEAIAQMRVGHATQLIAPREVVAAQQRYTQALDLIQTVGVQRTRAEGYLGLTLLYGFNGDMVAAEEHAREGLQIAETAGDDWIGALLLLALGGAAGAADDERSLGWLDQAQQRFERGGDSYGQALVALWRTLWHLRAENKSQIDALVAEVFRAVSVHGYEGVLIAPTLFGPRDMAMLVPLLLRGRSLPDHAVLAQQLLRQGFPSIAADETVDDYHPGYTLRVQMFGTFRVWRGQHEIQAREWQREKARQLFQLLLTYRGTWVQREQICTWLWPDSDLEAAERQFKVTLNALNAALEPTRPPRTAPFFIRRQGLAYSFAPSYGTWIDIDEFELRASGAATRDEPDFARRSGEIAVQLYKGDYLAEALYDMWTLEERERLLARFLTTTTNHARRLAVDGDYARAIQLCEQVLRRDRCYEEAYQVLMLAHAHSGSRSQALRSYARCVQALEDDMGMEPLPETVELYEQLKRNEPV